MNILIIYAAHFMRQRLSTIPMQVHLRRWLLVACLFNHTVFAGDVSEKINALIHEQLPHATVGIHVKDAESNAVIYSKYSNKLLVPASGMKLFTAAAALYYFGPKHQFETKLSEKNQNIYLTFGGDPSLSKRDLTALIAELKNHNITHIRGNFVLDTSRFKAPYYPNGISYEDLGWYYAAPDTAVMLDENTETYIVHAKKRGDLIQIKPKNTQPALTLINQVVTVSHEQANKHCNLDIEIKSHNTLRLYGCLAINEQPRLIYLSVPDPNLLATQRIQQALKQNNIRLDGKIITGHTPSNTKHIAHVLSPVLSDLVGHMLKKSDNLYANALTKQLGFAVMHEGNHKQGAFAITKIILQHTKLDMTQVDLADGMGTRYNLVTPKHMTDLLTAIYHDNTLRPIFFTALPKAGVSGNLQERMQKTALDKHVLAKTGTMHDMSSLSGYMIDAEGSKLIFSIIINGVNQPIRRAKALEESILLILHGR